MAKIALQFASRSGPCRCLCHDLERSDAHRVDQLTRFDQRQDLCDPTVCFGGRVDLDVGHVGDQAAEPQVDCFCRQWVGHNHSALKFARQCDGPYVRCQSLPVDNRQKTMPRVRSQCGSATPFYDVTADRSSMVDAVLDDVMTPIGCGVLLSA